MMMAAPLTVPTAVPLKGPTAVPLNGPTAVPLKGPTAVPLKGPTAVPLKVPRLSSRPNCFHKHTGNHGAGCDDLGSRKQCRVHIAVRHKGLLFNPRQTVGVLF